MKKSKYIFLIFSVIVVLLIISLTILYTNKKEISRPSITSASITEESNGLYQVVLSGSNFSASSKLFLYSSGVQQNQQGISPTSVSSDGKQSIFVLPYDADKVSYMIEVSNGTIVSNEIKLTLPQVKG